MSDSENDTPSVWSLLSNLREDIKSLDFVLDKVMTQTAIVLTKVEVLDKKTALLSKLLTEGNGQKSVLAQIAEFNARIKDLEEDGTSAASVQEKSADAGKARWVAIGKIAGIITLTIPGLLSFFTN